MKPALDVINQIGGTPGQQLVNLHGIFNLGLGVVFMALLGLPVD